MTHEPWRVSPIMENGEPLTLRRLASKPSHINCGCPFSFTPIVEPYTKNGVLQFVIAVEVKRLNDTARDDITGQVKRLDGSGGLAPYEDFGVIKNPDDLARSLAAACMRAGVEVLPSGDLQLPLFSEPENPPPLRLEIEEPPEF